jgi:hypothetical protein
MSPNAVVELGLLVAGTFLTLILVRADVLDSGVLAPGATIEEAAATYAWCRVDSEQVRSPRPSRSSATRVIRVGCMRSGRTA